MPPDFPDLFARHLAKRFSVAPDGTEEDYKILHGAAKHRAEQDPQHPGK